MRFSWQLSLIIVKKIVKQKGQTVQLIEQIREQCIDFDDRRGRTLGIGIWEEANSRAFPPALISSVYLANGRGSFGLKIMIEKGLLERYHIQ